MRPGEKVGAVVLGGDFQGLGVIRSLAENGIPVFLVEHEWSIGRYSRYSKRKKYYPQLLDENKFLPYLMELSSKEDLRGWVLFPNSDDTVKLLSIHKDELSRVYKVTVPSWDVVRIFYYKLNCYEYASRLGIPVPKTYKHNNLEELLSQPLEYPLVLKPNNKEKYFAITKKKAVRVDNPGALKFEYSKMAALVKPENVVVQEMIVGGPKHLYSFATVFDGENILAGLSARRVRQHPMDFGRATTYAEAVEIPELEDLALRLLRGIKYTGIAEVEFMFDEKTGLYKFLEINGRPWGWHTLTKAAGVNMPLALFRYVQGERIERLRPKYDVKWLRLITDLPVILGEIASGRLSLREYGKSWDRNPEFAVFSRKDPVPFFMEFLMLPYLYYKRGY